MLKFKQDEKGIWHPYRTEDAQPDAPKAAPAAKEPVKMPARSTKPRKEA